MSKYVDKVTYKLDLSNKLKGLEHSERRQALEEVGNYLVEQILQDVSRMKSPVANGSWKTSLSTKYLERKKQLSSSPRANMELTGAMLDSLTYKVSGDSVEIGIFDYDEAQKADNHNKFSEASKTTAVPKRNFIPNADKRENFRKDIQREVTNIIQEAIDGSKD